MYYFICCIDFSSIFINLPNKHFSDLNFHFYFLFCFYLYLYLYLYFYFYFYFYFYYFSDTFDAILISSHSQYLAPFLVWNITVICIVPGQQVLNQSKKIHLKK